MIDDDDADAIIGDRIAGKSVREIAKARRKSVSEVYRVLDLWCDQTIATGFASIP